MKTIEDGIANYSNLLTTDDGLVWNVLIRAGGSISLYATNTGYMGHGVAWDSLDGKPPSEFAQKIIQQLGEMAEGINALLDAVRQMGATNA